VNVGEMQRKLSLWADQDKERKFYGLYDLLYDKDWLHLAHDYVAQNAGSITAGCDGIDMKTFDENLEENLKALAEEMKTEKFEPYPVRRVYIPKANGKMRPLGIPSIRDRIVQEAIRMVLEPIYEADFSQHSFGFRPNRCTMDAIRCIANYTTENAKFFWVIEGDIASYFDTINHEKLIELIRRRVKDEWLIALIWKFLRAGTMEGKLFRDTKLGTPQGGIISPLLANIYLHELDRYLSRCRVLPQKEKTKRREQGQANYAGVRYADDFVILSNGTREQAETLKEEVSLFLKEELMLDLSQEKTKVTHINDGFIFLGFRITRGPGQKGMKRKVYIPQEAVDKLMDKTSATTSPQTYQDSVNSKILALNRIIGGWCRYYQYTSRASSTFHEIEQSIFWKVAHWLGRKFKLPMTEVMKRFKDHQSGSLTTGERRLVKATEFPTKIWTKRYIKPNPYITREFLTREELPSETHWTGYETRLGMADLRPLILKRDDFICQRCGKRGTPKTLHVDHIRPVRRFKRPVDANVPENLQTLHIEECHRKKTKEDRQMESRVR